MECERKLFSVFTLNLLLDSSNVRKEQNKWTWKKHEFYRIASALENILILRRKYFLKEPFEILFREEKEINEKKKKKKTNSIKS